ncbi:MAG: hypothetical protein MUP68_10565 [Deltaproteobacteria bacterium]|nr:hypothetical protein [Deltaproteobacteria bacterium]
MNPSRQNDFYRLPEGKHSHPSFFRLPWAVLLFVFFLGCATVPPLPIEPVKEEAPPPALPPSVEQVTAKDPFEAFPAKYRAKAIALERKENWRRALFYWQVVSRLRPDDQEFAGKIKTLEARIRSEAEKHFLKGLEHYQKKSLPAARQEFLITLAYNPDHPQALEYLKYKLNDTDLIFYETKEGDTLRKIAGAIYHDPDKDFLVAYFNDLPSSDKLKSGLTLRLPILESAAATVAAARPVSSDEMLTKARALLKAKKYDQAVRYAEKILEYTPANSEANDLKNASYYQLGIRLLQKKEYRESLRMFKKADITYKNVREMVTNLEKRLQDHKTQAENHYQKGVGHFLAEELDEAVQEWEKTLQLDPQHLKAKKDIEQVRRLQEKLRKIQ